MENNKIIFIGPKEIHNAFVGMLPSYNFQKPIESLQDFFTELNNQDSEISFDVQSIMVFSRLFDSDPDNFTKAVAFYAPYALVSVLIPEDDISSGKQNAIELAVKNEQKLQEQQAAANGDSYDVNTPFYFVRYEDPKVGIITAMSEYVVSPYVEETLKPNIIEMLPPEYRVVVKQDADFQEFDENEYPEEFSLPEADTNAKGQVIAITSSKGGSGKSTVSLGLASYLKLASTDAVQKGLETRELSVCVIDLDTRDGQLGFLVGQTTPTIFNIMDKTPADGIDETAVRAGVYSDPKSGCDYIFAPRRARNASNIPPAFYANLIQKLRSMYDIIIVDTSVNYLDELLSKVAYPLADKIAFVTDMGLSSIMGMARWVHETTKPEEKNGSGIDKNKIGIVVNKVMNDVNMGPDKIQTAASGLDIIAMLPSVPYFVTYKANTNALHELHENRIINLALKNFAETVIGNDYKLGEVPYDEK